MSFSKLMAKMNGQTVGFLDPVYPRVQKLMRSYRQIRHLQEYQ